MLLDPGTKKFDIEARRTIVKLERTWDMETLYDLAILLATAVANGTINNEDIPDSREHMDFVIIWANEFNEHYAWEDWDRSNYLQSVNDWFEKKIISLVKARRSNRNVESSGQAREQVLMELRCHELIGRETNS